VFWLVKSFGIFAYFISHAILIYLKNISHDWQHYPGPSILHVCYLIWQCYSDTIIGTKLRHSIHLITAY
jgi:hypothetical protein